MFPSTPDPVVLDTSPTSEKGMTMEFGKRMRIKRKLLRMSQADLGEKVGVSAATICGIEQGKECNPKTLAAVKKLLGIRRSPATPKASKPKPATDPVLAALAEISASLTSLRAILVAAASQPAPAPVEHHRGAPEVVTQGIARNGLRRPLASNSLDPVPGARLMPTVGAGA